MELQLKIIGILFILLGFMHVIFPKYFNWKEELSQLSLINKEMMIIHTFFIGFMVILMGLLCLTSASDLVHTPLGKKIALGFFIFWFARWIIQFWGYSSELWRGKKFETIAHIIFSLFWTYLCVIFFMVSQSLSF